MTIENPTVPVSPADIRPDTMRPTADFADPLLCQLAYEIEDDVVGLNAFLVALAAFQRGLSVRFHYEVVSKSPRFANAVMQGFRGELFSVHGGGKTHFFRRTLGDLTPAAVSQLCDDKPAVKAIWAKHGVASPPGLVVDDAHLEDARRFVARFPERRFVLKPVDGTLGQGVHRNLTPEAVLPALAACGADPHLLEVFVPGRLFRVNVVGGRYVGAYELRCAHLVGDGQHSIKTLVEQKNAACRHRPLYPTQRLTLREREQAALSKAGLTADSVLPVGECVFLNDIPLGDEGADLLDATETLPDPVRIMAVRACQVLNLPVGGLDVIVDDHNHGVFLEANQNPLLHGNAFPRQSKSPGNRVAEAIIDYYFPESIDNPRHTKAGFDFLAVRSALSSGAIAEVDLPVLAKGWVHRRFHVPPRQIDDPDKLISVVRRKAHVYGVHLRLVYEKHSGLLIDVLAPKQRCALFLDVLQGQ